MTQNYVTPENAGILFRGGLIGPTVLDRFDVNQADILGKPMTPYPLAGVTWFRASTGGIIVAPSFNGGNMIPGLQNANMQRTAGVLGPLVPTNNRRYVYYFNPSNFVQLATGANIVQFITDLLELNPSVSYSKMRFSWQQAAVAGGTLTGDLSTGGQINAGTNALTFNGGPANSAQALSLDAGDCFMIDVYTLGLTKFVDVYKNWFRILQGTTDLNTAPFNINFTNRSGISANGNVATERLTEFYNYDPTREAGFWLFDDSHIAQTAYWDATNPTWYNNNMFIGYSGDTAPSGVTWTLYDTSVDPKVAVAGFIDVPLVLTPYTYPFAAYTIPLTRNNQVLRASVLTPPTTPQYHIELTWPNVPINGVANAFLRAFTPVKFGGEKLAWFQCQSRGTQGWQSAAGFAFAQGLNTYSQDCSNDNIGANWIGSGVTEDLKRRTSRQSLTAPRANATNCYMIAAQYLQTMFGHNNFELWRCGLNGTALPQRAIGSAYWDSFVYGMIRCTDFGVGSLIDDAFEIDNSGGFWPVLWDAAAVAQFKSIVYPQYRVIEAFAGHRCKFPYSPFYARQSATAALNARADAFMSMLHQIIISDGDGEFPGRFSWGANNNCIQHGTGGADVYHYVTTQNGYGTVAWFWAHDFGLARGVSPGRLGPTPSGNATRVDPVTIDLEMKANGATTLLLRGGTVADPRAGNHFYSDAAMTAEILPIAIAAPGPVVGDLSLVRYTFGAPLPVPVYISGVRGSDPANPTGSGVIAADKQNLAPAIVGDYGDPGVGVDYFNPSNNFYLNASGTNQIVLN